MFYAFLLLPLPGSYGQTFSAASQQSLNNYVSFINATAKQGGEVIMRLKEYHDEIAYAKKHSSTRIRPYTCISNLPQYEYNLAKEETSRIGNSQGQLIQKKGVELWQAAEQLDQHCKALETYIRLEDYKTDNFKKLEELLVLMQKDLALMREKQVNLDKQVRQVYRLLQPYNASNAYHLAEKQMLEVLESERNLLSEWTFHFNEQIPTGFPQEELINSVNKHTNKSQLFTNNRKDIAYPASSMLGSFANSIESIQTVKRAAIDQYTYEARQSDIHANQTYADLLNYYNNDMIVNFNAFVNYSKGNGQRLLFYSQLLPLFEVEKKKAVSSTAAVTVENTPFEVISVQKQSKPISKTTHDALLLYVDFINESVRAINHLQRNLRFYDINEATFEGKKKLAYVHQDFVIPISYYQAAIQAQSPLAQNHKKLINTQAEVLLNVLKEMDALGIELYKYTQNGSYASDNFNNATQIRDRYIILFESFDQKKEQLYKNIHAIYTSYPLAEPANSWNVSGIALAQTVELDKELVFAAREIAKGKSSALPATEKLTLAIRSVIAEEFTNLKGIQKIGRNNGLCPYTPYEDIPQHSKTLLEQAQRILKPVNSNNAHPYEGIVNIYNRIVYDYNKFADLAKTPLLKNIIQPSLFLLRQPYGSSAQPLARNTPENATPVSTSFTDNHKVFTQHDTIRVVEVQKTEITRTDTIYIEKTKVDTVFLTREGSEDFLSMKGYATNNLVLLLDVSSSMDAPQKLPLLKKSVKLLLQILRPEDEIAIVIYSGTAKTVLPPTSAREADKINKLIDKLRSDGSTDGNEGIELAYKVASKNYKRGGNNRIVLASDGAFPVSQQTVAKVKEQALADILLSVFDFGNNPATTTSLQQLAENGLGGYTHVTPDNADASLIKQAKAKVKAK